MKNVNSLGYDDQKNTTYNFFQIFISCFSHLIVMKSNYLILSLFSFVLPHLMWFFLFLLCFSFLMDTVSTILILLYSNFFLYIILFDLIFSSYETVSLFLNLQLPKIPLNTLSYVTSSGFYYLFLTAIRVSRTRSLQKPLFSPFQDKLLSALETLDF